MEQESYVQGVDYFITRDKQMMGRYSELDIRYGLAEGKFYGSDIGWCAGMEEGLPLDELIAPGNKPLPPRKPRAVEEVSVASVHQARRPGASRPRGTSAMAVFAFLMGVLSLLTCGLLGVGAVITLIMGHMALSRIGKSDGRLAGRGVAVCGLVMGYLSLVLMSLIVVAMFLPAFTDFREQISRQAFSGVTSVKNAQSIVLACQQYAAKHEGLFPDNLDVLVQEQFIEDPRILRDPLLNDHSQIGYEYLGEGMKASDPDDAIVLRGKSHINGMRVIARKNGIVTFTPSP